MSPFGETMGTFVNFIESLGIVWPRDWRIEE